MTESPSTSPGTPATPRDSAASSDGAGAIESRTSSTPASPGGDTLVQALRALGREAVAALHEASDASAVEAIRILYLGRKEGKISGILRGLGTLAPKERPVVGAVANEVRGAVEAALAEAEARSSSLGGSLGLGDTPGSTGSSESGDSPGSEPGQAAISAGSSAHEAPVRRMGDAPRRTRSSGPGATSEVMDLSLPGRRRFLGARHPITQVVDELWEIFRGMGFTRARGPEAETEWYNFEALNTPLDHPAADEQDTLYLAGGHLLRSHTSPVQVRVMEAYKPPIRILAPGMVYRRDTYDATHAPAFLQLEGLVVDEGVTFVDLKATLAEFARRYWGPGTRIRFRPSFFPFTEPSAEVDVKRVAVGPDGAERETDWLEIMGAGMVDPAVLEAAGIDPERYSGFAFGMGPARIGMLKYGIPDIRAFFENDVRFLSQFASRASHR